MPKQEKDMSDETNYAIVTAARRILAKQQSLPLDELVRRITKEESSPDGNRASVVKNILKQYIATGYFAQNGDTVCAYNGPSEVLLERGFKQTHVNHGTGNEVLQHFSNSAFPNVYFQIFDYGDGTWSHYIATHRTKEEYAEVERIVSELNELPGRIRHKIWP
jgi:hypothetical protein